MVTDEKGDTAGVIINIGRKMVAEVLKWNDLRINGVKMHLPFENSEMVAEVFCGLVQITTNVGFAVTMDKEPLLSFILYESYTYSIYKIYDKAFPELRIIVTFF